MLKILVLQKKQKIPVFADIYWLILVIGIWVKFDIGASLNNKSDVYSLQEINLP